MITDVIPRALAIVTAATLLIGAHPTGQSLRNSPAPLEATAWQLVKFQGRDGKVLRPQDKTLYTVEFRRDGRVIARFDCNRGSGTWKSDGKAKLEFGPIALTRAMCPPESLHDHLLKRWGSIRSYVMKDGHLFLSLMANGGSYEFEPQPKVEPKLVALTFDDLPAHGPVPPGLTRLDIATSIIGTLKKYDAPPTYGFINARQLERTPEDIEVLKAWRAAGYPLGNHAFSHMDLHANSAEAFAQDVLANEASLRTLMGDGDWRWFRYPYLREGDTPEKYQAVRSTLASNKYRVAQVTLDFSDYAYNDPYARCLAKNDTASIEWLKQSYLDRAGQSLTRGQDLAQTIFGREIKHVMLLHIGGFETVMLPRLLDLLKERGFTLATLEEAQSDEIYKTVPVRDANWSGTLLNQLRPRPAALPAEAQKPPAAPADDVFARLSALCRN